MAYEDTEDYLNLLKAQIREGANFAEPGTETTEEFMKRTGTKATPPKGRVVTKEEMKKAGFDNLRDFLNAERGLKRKDGSAPSKAEPSKSKVATDTGDETTRLMKRAGVSDKNLMTGETTIRGYGERIDPRFTKGLTYGRRAEMRAGMKKGGMVSSASKRADGCAKKGKTRGKMV